MKYIVTCISTEREYTVEAKNAQQAKRIVCRWKNVSSSDYWCGLTNYTARKVKNRSASTERQ